MQSHTVLSCKKFEIFHLHLPPRLLQTRTKIMYLMCTILCTINLLSHIFFLFKSQEKRRCRCRQ
jgi:hypothetical protein